jgi:aspartate-semialdehyde dehydrogenase
LSRIAIVHPLTLVGKELRERLDAAPALATDVRLFASDEEEIGTVTEAAGGATFVHRIEDGAFDDVDLVLLCGDISRDRQALAQIAPGTRVIVLSSGATSADGEPAAADLDEARWLSKPRLLSPSPAALLVARLVAAAQQVGVQRAVASVVLPVSEYDQRGLDTLFDETRALLTFSNPKKAKLFAGQVAFNLIPGRPDGAEIERQIAAILGDGAPAVAVQSAQGGVFHALSASVHLTLADGYSIADLKRTLSSSSELRFVKHGEKLGPVEAAGEDRILVGDLRESGAGGFWLWAAMDNLTTGRAVHALRLAAALLGSGPVS